MQLAGSKERIAIEGKYGYSEYLQCNECLDMTNSSILNG